MRAVAVIAVILNHVSSSLLPGGYLGVDVFFVISGFVITRSLLGRQQMPAGPLLLDFYARRIRRLLPSLVVAVIVGSLLIRLFDPQPLRSMLTGALALVGASNLYLYSEAVDYFGGTAQLNMFTHTWSLGVEEQFYLVFPLLFVLSSRRGMHVILFVLATLTFASLVAFVIMSRVDQPAAYFLMPFRFWELGLGCLLPLIGRAQWRVPSWPLSVAPIVSFALLFAGLATPEAWTTAATLLVVASTAMLINGLTNESTPKRLLGSAAMAYVGRISYSLYIWHWLVLCLSNWTIGIHWWSVPVQLGFIFVGAAASYHWVEAPLRRGRWMGTHRKSMAVGGSLVCVAMLVIAASHRTDQPRFVGTAKYAAIGAATRYAGRYTGRQIDDCLPKSLFRDGRLQDLTPCLAGTSKPLLVFMGDSHAMDLFPMADRIAAHHGASVLNIAQNGCRAPALAGEPEYCRYHNALIDDLARLGGDVILVLRNNYNPRKIDFSLDRFIAQLTEFVDHAAAAGMRTVYVAPAPKYPGIGPTSVCVEQWFRPAWAIAERCRTGQVESRAEQLARRIGFMNALEELATQRTHFAVFDPFEILCGPDPLRCSPIREGRALYRDESHLTEEASELLAAPFVSALRDRGKL